MQFVGGKHGPIDVDKQPKKAALAEDAMREPKVSSVNSSAYIGAYESKNPLDTVVRDRISSEFSGMWDYQAKKFARFKRDGERTLCTVVAWKTKVSVYYGRQGDFSEDDFIRDVSNVGHYGTGDYCSDVRDEADLEKLLLTLKRMDRLLRFLDKYKKDG